MRSMGSLASGSGQDDSDASEDPIATQTSQLIETPRKESSCQEHAHWAIVDLWRRSIPMSSYAC